MGETIDFVVVCFFAPYRVLLFRRRLTKAVMNEHADILVRLLALANISTYSGRGSAMLVLITQTGRQRN